MPAIVRRSTDPGAPVLSGLAGKLIDVLDAVLVTAAGWEKQFSDTQRAAYRMPAGTRSVLYVDDRGTLSGSSHTSLLRGFETMSSIDAGSGPFPTTAQVANGIAYQKSSTADSTAQNWIAVATSTAVAVAHIAAGTTRYGFVFGDLDPSHSPSAPGRCVLMEGASDGAFGQAQGNLTTTSTDHYIARGWSTGVSAACAKIAHSTIVGGGANVAAGTYPYPDSVSGGFLAIPLLIAEGGRVQGRAPILYGHPHPAASFTDGTTYTDADGTQYVAVQISGGNSPLLKIS